jgi:antitoxin component YwqK of YwqJK toxin-antitoxin module
MRVALAGLALALAASACDRPPKADDRLRSNFATVKLEGDSIVDATRGQPYTGTVVARDREIGAIARFVLRGTPAEEAIASAHTDGLILVLPVTGGVPSGRATLHVDLRAPKLDNEITKLYGELGAAVAKELSPTVEVGEATLQGGKLTGNAVLLVPGAAFGRGNKLAYARFKDNLLDGDSVEYFAGTEQAHHERRFVAGVRSGKQKSFFRNGRVAAEAVYDGDAPHGEVRDYYASSALRSRRSYDHGRPVGTAEAWFPSGARERTVTYGADGSMTGTEWYSNGAVKARWGPDGKQEVPAEGDLEDYFDTGKVEHRTHYTAGVKDGAFEVLYADGKRREAGSYAHGVPTGRHQKWWPDGRVALDATWVAGALDGAYKRWYADGTPWEEATYAGGRLDGRYRKWWRNGAVAHDYTYDHGKLAGEYRQFYDNGQLWAIGTYDHGKPRGVLLRWFRDGQLGSEQHHRNGRPHGPYLRWYASGQPRLVASYVDGRLDGELQNWREDGSLYERATFQRGQKMTTTLSTTLAPAR